LLSCRNSLCILNKSSLSPTWIVNILSQSESCFSIVKWHFIWEKFFSFAEFNYHNFLWFLFSVPKKKYLSQVKGMFSMLFFPRSFVSCFFLFKNMSHLEWFLYYTMWSKGHDAFFPHEKPVIAFVKENSVFSIQ
jgi:hypothetical protein